MVEFTSSPYLTALIPNPANKPRGVLLKYPPYLRTAMTQEKERIAHLFSSPTHEKERTAHLFPSATQEKERTTHLFAPASQEKERTAH